MPNQKQKKDEKDELPIWEPKPPGGYIDIDLPDLLPEGVDPVPADELFQKYYDETIEFGNCIIRLNKLTFDQLKRAGYQLVNQYRQFTFEEQIAYGKFIPQPF